MPKHKLLLNPFLTMVLGATLLAQAKPVDSATGTTAQVLSWKSSAVWTGDQAGPSDANGRTWYATDFDDSTWSSIALPDQGLDTNANDRYYRAHFEWDGLSAVTLSFVSDDGLSVYVNGIALGTWGNGWRQSGCVNNGPPTCFNSLTVAPQTVPMSSLHPGDNVIAVDVWNAPACCFHYFNPALTLKRTDLSPIVLVHGFNGFSFKILGCPQADPDDYFEQVDEYLEEEQLQVYTARLTSSGCYTPRLQDNVKRLMTAIGEAISTTGQSKVILITHSMGGLVARAYIEGKQYRDDVSAVFTFGSPHWGIPVEVLIYQSVKYFGIKGGLVGGASLGALCLTLQPAICDFSTTGMALFNLQHRPRGDVPYYFISGDAPDLTRNAAGLASGFLVPGPDDGLVPTSSGKGIALPGPIRRLTTAELHSKVFASTSASYSTYFINSTGAKTESYQNCLASALINQQGCGAITLNANQPDSPGQPDLMLMADRARQTDTNSRTSVEYGTFVAGQSITREITSDGGSATFAAMWQTGTVSVTLINPVGQFIDPAYAAANPALVSYAASEDVATYTFTSTTPGVWQLILKPTNTLADGAAYATFASFGNGVTLSGEMDRLWYGPGATAHFTVSLTGAASDITVQANIVRADALDALVDIVDIVTMTQTAPGIYTAAYAVPAEPGYAEVRFVATGKTSSGNAFEREANLAFQISPATASLTGSYAEVAQPRTTGLPLYQALTITVGISSTSNDLLSLSADLVDGTGTFVAHCLATQNVGVGAKELPLRFDGDDIAASRRNGPYKLTNVLLTDQSGPLMALAQAQNVYDTATYRFADFGRTQSVFLPWVQKASAP